MDEDFFCKKREVEDCFCTQCKTVKELIKYFFDFPRYVLKRWKGCRFFLISFLPKCHSLMGFHFSLGSETTLFFFGEDTGMSGEEQCHKAYHAALALAKAPGVRVFGFQVLGGVHCGGRWGEIFRLVGG